VILVCQQESCNFKVAGRGQVAILAVKTYRLVLMQLPQILTAIAVKFEFALANCKKLNGILCIHQSRFLNQPQCRSHNGTIGTVLPAVYAKIAR
jgi:hypothetical protein